MKRQTGDPVGEKATRRQAWIAAVLALCAALGYIALASQLPIAIRSDAAHDDAWFWLRARAIAGGGWLGGYDHYTLMKGAGYPLFLAIVHALGISLATAQAVLYAGACLLLGHALYRTTGRPWLALLVVVVLQWHPAAMTWGVVLRDNVSAAQTLLVLGCVLQATWVRRSPRARLGWAAAAGLVLGWFWTTREDGIWLLPGIALLLLAPIAWAWHERAHRRAVIVASATLVLASLGWLGLVATANGVKYGEFVVTEVKDAAFSEALGALHGVQVGPVVPFVPVPRQVREAVYRVSPTFARLRPALEAPDNFWTGPGCGLYAHACGDFAAGWFLWALRDAVHSVGGYETASSAARLYRDLAGEVQRACEDGRLQCRRPLIELMPVVSDEQWRSLPGRLRAAAALLAWQDVHEPRLRSGFDHHRSMEMWRFIGRPRVAKDVEQLGVRASGWLRAPDGAWLQARCSERTFAIKLQPSPDLVAHFNDPTLAERRFTLRLPAEHDCRLELLPGGEGSDLASVTKMPARLELGGAELHLETVVVIPPSSAAPGWALQAKAIVWRSYALMLPWLAGAGLLAFAWALARALTARRACPLLVLAAAGWGLVSGRTLLLSLVDLSAFPAINHQYLQAVFPLLTLATIASLAAATGRSPRY